MPRDNSPVKEGEVTNIISPAHQQQQQAYSKVESTKVVEMITREMVDQVVEVRSGGSKSISALYELEDRGLEVSKVALQEGVSGGRVYTHQGKELVSISALEEGV